MTKYNIYRQVYLNRMTKIYETILVVRPRVNHKDNEIIRSVTKLLHIGKLSTFDSETNYGRLHCETVIVNPITNKLLLEKDITVFLNYLQEHECKIDYKLSKVLKNNTSNSNFILSVDI